MATKEISMVSPTENRRIKTTINVKQVYLNGLEKVSAGKLTMTAMFDEALADFLAKKNNTQEIDQMLKQTGSFWLERSLSNVVAMLPQEKVKKLIPYQIAYLYFNLKDAKDRERVFEAISLSDELKQMHAMDAILQQASDFNGEELKGYNLHKAANDMRAKPTPLQTEYLALKIGKEAFSKIQERRPDLFPTQKIPLNQTEKELTESATTEAAEVYELFPEQE